MACLSHCKVSSWQPGTLVCVVHSYAPQPYPRIVLAPSWGLENMFRGSASMHFASISHPVDLIRRENPFLSPFDSQKHVAPLFLSPGPHGWELQ